MENVMYKVDEYTTVEYICTGGEDHSGCAIARERGIEGIPKTTMFKAGNTIQEFFHGIVCEFCGAPTRAVQWRM
jgi:hypothetical protein